jgi:hypothetical protein
MVQNLYKEKNKRKCHVESCTTGRTVAVIRTTLRHILPLRVPVEVLVLYALASTAICQVQLLRAQVLLARVPVPGT